MSAQRYEVIDRILATRFAHLLRMRIFWMLTIGVHGIALAAATGFHAAEKGSALKPLAPLDCLYWAVATLTTVGYGDVTPVTTAGKFIALGLMVVGVTAAAAYSAVFVSVLIAPELRNVEHRMARTSAREEMRMEELLERISADLDELKRSAGKR